MVTRNWEALGSKVRSVGNGGFFHHTTVQGAVDWIAANAGTKSATNRWCVLVFPGSFAGCWGSNDEFDYVTIAGAFPGTTTLTNGPSGSASIRVGKSGDDADVTGLEIHGLRLTGDAGIDIAPTGAGTQTCLDLLVDGCEFDNPVACIRGDPPNALFSAEPTWRVTNCRMKTQGTGFEHLGPYGRFLLSDIWIERTAGTTLPFYGVTDTHTGPTAGRTSSQRVGKRLLIVADNVHIRYNSSYANDHYGWRLHNVHGGSYGSNDATKIVLANCSVEIIEATSGNNLYGFSFGNTVDIPITDYNVLGGAVSLEGGNNQYAINVQGSIANVGRVEFARLRGTGAATAYYAAQVGASATMTFFNVDSNGSSTGAGTFTDTQGANIP